MKTYSVLFAEDVPHYGTVEIEAEDDCAVLQAAMSYDFSEVSTDPEWENSGCRRIVHIEDADGNFLHEDVPLDNLFIRYGGEKERVLCDAAPQLLKALEVCERAIKEATDIMHYENGLPVTALEGRQIERAYDTLRNASILAGEAIAGIGTTRGAPRNPADPATACLADILRYLLHWSEQNGWDFEEAMRIARRGPQRG